MPDASIPDLAASEYALIRPPVPRSVPPKYLVTIIRQFAIPLLSSTSSIGFPAVPEGSPSSLNLFISLLFPILYYMHHQ